MIHVDMGNVDFAPTSGRHHGGAQLMEIRKNHEASETLVDECGHPRHASLHLKVTPISGCDGFEEVRMSSSQGHKGGKKVSA